MKLGGSHSGLGGGKPPFLTSRLSDLSGLFTVESPSASIRVHPRPNLDSFSNSIDEVCQQPIGGALQVWPVRCDGQSGHHVEFKVNRE
jgi:hypothetical protein